MVTSWARAVAAPSSSTPASHDKTSFLIGIPPFGQALGAFMHDPCLAGARRNDKAIRGAGGRRSLQPREIVGIPHNRDIAWAICTRCLGETGGMQVADDHSTDMVVVSLSF